MPEAPTPDDAIKNAIAHQRAGRLAEAEAIYREILQAQRDHLAATRMLGILFSQRREYTQAIQFLQRAAALSGNNAAIALDLAVVYRAAGQVDTAGAHVPRRFIEASPPFPRAFREFAQYLREAGRAPDAVPVATRFTELEPSWDSVNLLGMTLAESQSGLPRRSRRLNGVSPSRRKTHRAITAWGPAIWSAADQLRQGGTIVA